MKLTTFRRFAPAGLVFIGVLMLAVAVAIWQRSPGPAVPLWTGSGSCYLSNARGELVVDDTVGVAITERFGGTTKATKIKWPAGYTARRSGSEVEVLDRRGQVVARTGTRMQIQGGYGPGGGFEVCALTFLDGSSEMTLLP